MCIVIVIIIVVMIVFICICLPIVIGLHPYFYIHLTPMPPRSHPTHPCPFAGSPVLAVRAPLLAQVPATAPTNIQAIY